MDSRFLQHRAKIYKATIVTRDLQEVCDMTMICRDAPCKVTTKKAKWQNGEYVMDRSEDTVIMFEPCQDVQVGYELLIGTRRYLVSDAQIQDFISGHGGSLLTTCKLL